MTDVKKIAQLLYKYTREPLSEEEKLVLEEWRRASPHNERLMHELSDEAGLLEKLRAFDPGGREALRTRILNRVKEAGNKPDKENKGLIIPIRRTYFRLGWVAASVVLIALVAGYLISDKPELPSPVAIVQAPQEDDFPPGKEGALLILADGSELVLDSMANGQVTEQAGSRLSLESGELSYSYIGGDRHQTGWNTMITPRGRQFRLILPDGTRVWLNAASSLRYPTHFNQEVRQVELTGEAYFEVAKRAEQPFKVVVNESTMVEVLGTHFNINSYRDEPAIKATLLEGSVKVIANGNAVMLKPSQQAIVKEQISVDRSVDLQQVMAWKNGQFNFEGATVEEFMRQLARWYDLDVVYKGPAPKKVFHGDLGRDLQLSQILKVIDFFNISYKMEGKTLTIE